MIGNGVCMGMGQSYSVSEELEELDSPAGTCDPLCSVDEMSSVDFEASYKPNSDIIKAVTIGAGALGVAAVVNHSWVAENQARILCFQCRSIDRSREREFTQISSLLVYKENSGSILELSFKSMALFVGSLSPMIFYRLFCIQKSIISFHLWCVLGGSV